ncbi:MAG: hypothetical protein ACRD3O_23740, partial [Terriglobia bacterium]
EGGRTLITPGGDASGEGEQADTGGCLESGVVIGLALRSALRAPQGFAPAGDPDQISSGFGKESCVSRHSQQHRIQTRQEKKQHTYTQCKLSFR